MQTQESIQSKLGQNEVGPGRLETLTDGIFAIAMTILVFGLVLPNNTTPSTLPGSLDALWPNLLHSCRRDKFGE